jgi:cation diffusion facilitator family transporter
MSKKRAMDPAEKAEGIDVVASIFMAVGMIAIASLSHSVSVLAEGIDTCVDVIASLSVMIGLKLSKRHSRDFPNGLYKLENLVAIAIGVLILFSAYELARESISKLAAGGKNPINQPWVAMGTMAIVVLITGALAWYKGAIGKKVHSPSLSADSRHSWTDTIASAAVILGVGLQAAGVPYIDSIVALIIVAILAWSGAGVIRDGFKVLLDASIEKEVLDEASALAVADPDVTRVAKVQGRNSGSYRFLHLTIVTDVADLKDADAVAERVRGTLMKKIQNIEQVVIDYVAEEAAVTTCAVALAEDGASLASGLVDAAAFSLCSIDPLHPVIEDRSSFIDPYSSASEGREIKLAIALAQRGVQVLLLKDRLPESSPYYLLEANEVRLLQAPDASTLEEAEKALLEAVRADAPQSSAGTA